MEGFAVTRAVLLIQLRPVDPAAEGVSGLRSSTASCSASEGSGARPASEGSCVWLLSVELARPVTAQEPSDADLLVESVELDTEAPTSSAPEVLAPPQRSLPTAEPEKQPSQTQPVPTAEVLLPESWKQTLPRERHQWVNWALFTREQSGRPALTKNLCLWWWPPGPRLVYAQPSSSPDAFFHSRLFLWMPYRMWAFKLPCAQPECRRLGHKLTACGLYKTVQRVPGVPLLHRQQWLAKSSEYLYVLRKFLALGTDPCTITITRQLPPMVPVYAQDMLSQLEEMKARATSAYGDVLKMDSTKKVTKGCKRGE
ncbi:hypothetical protein P4O66_002927 [Electrophorus voltai]|uniref:DUF6729 domain-containing protein n=1 Tax=Electrophorus voltai TaxID=2609070 RepID=A0AAD8YX57_9TELE|nr:hypothetical protein P4O66_002927 [Electrophorus voltai]